MNRLIVMRLFQVVLAIVTSLAVWEIAAIGPDADRGDPTRTITYLVTGNDATAFLAAVVSLAAGIGLATHFIVERRNRQ